MCCRTFHNVEDFVILELWVSYHVGGDRLQVVDHFGRTLKPKLNFCFQPDGPDDGWKLCCVVKLAAANWLSLVSAAVYKLFQINSRDETAGEFKTVY